MGHERERERRTESRGVAPQAARRRREERVRRSAKLRARDGESGERAGREEQTEARWSRLMRRNRMNLQIKSADKLFVEPSEERVKGAVRPEWEVGRVAWIEDWAIL